MINSLDILKEYVNIITLSDNLFQIKNNDTDELIEKEINLTINNPISINSNLFNDNIIPFSKINNPLFFDEKENLFPDYTGNDEIIDNFLNAYDQSTLNKKQVKSYMNIINNNNIVLNLNKPPGFDYTLRELFIKNGTFKLLLNDNVLYEDKINKLLYNSDLYDYIDTKEEYDKYILNNYKDIPFNIVNDTLYVTSNYDLDVFVIKISDYDKFLSNVTSDYTSNYMIQESLNMYELNFSILFELNETNKFPIKLGHYFNNLINNINNVLNNIITYKIIINDFPKTIDFIDNINNNVYNNLFLVFR